MKKYVIDEEVCKEKGLDLNLVFTILLLSTGKTYEESIEELLKRDILINNDSANNVSDRYLITYRWSDMISEMFLDSEIGSNNAKKLDIRLLDLAKKLMEIFPEGKKEGTNHYWRCNRVEVKQKLKKFLNLYGKYSDEDIIEATKSYVAMHNGGDTTMRILKYFILKDDVSDLASILENKGHECNKNDIGELV